ncbi:hypothetical protein L3X38_024306 [Prunus dulcis]|uniref:Terpene synthase N-terminal domain-containing protein n=1 Tax=Prunus dulcis TaxID=3755 RepID=A0AAD4VZN9_PRUDU|nr:hypothetical protein L3X38_024306 [Prunus dulcis]
MKYQRKNGSLFNSPSTTAAAFTHLKNPIPTIYPLDNYARLTMASSLESLGIDRHFMAEITVVLDETYRCRCLLGLNLHLVMIVSIRGTRVYTVLNSAPLTKLQHIPHIVLVETWIRGSAIYGHALILILMRVTRE